MLYVFCSSGLEVTTVSNAFYIAGKYAEAEPLHEWSQSIREHPDMAESLDNRAGLLHSLIRPIFFLEHS